jgi:LPS sulfotransferase NodH
LLASPRSGSTLLLDYVGRLQGVRCYGEVLGVNTPIGLKSREYQPQTGLRHIRRSLQALRAPIRGCKLMLWQLSRCGLKMDDVHEAFPTAKYLIIYRESLVEQYVSQRTAVATGQWTVRQGSTPRQARVKVDAAELGAFSAHLRQSYEALLSHAWLRERSVLLSYEQLVANAGKWFSEEICPFLGTAAGQLQTQFVKQNSRPLADRIENYHAVEELLASPTLRLHLAWPDVPRPVSRAA